MKNWKSVASLALIGAACLAEGAALAKAPAVEAKVSAKCIKRIDAAGARALVLSVPGSADEAARWGALDRVLLSCDRQASSQLSNVEKALIIGALAEPIAREFGDIRGSWKGVPDRDALALSASRMTLGYPTEAAIARCLFVAYPDEVLSLVQEKPGSAKESRAFAALQLVMSKCVNAGTNVSMTRSQFRAEMIRAFVRYVYVPNDPKPSAHRNSGTMSNA